MNKPIITTISKCARCGGYHTDMLLEQLTQPLLYRALPIATHWAPCPTNGEPILLAIVTEQPEDKQ